MTEHGYTIGSPMSLKAQVSLICINLFIQILYRQAQIKFITDSNIKIEQDYSMSELLY